MAEIGDFLQDRKRILFFPYALQDHDSYAGRIEERFRDLSYKIESAHRSESLLDSIAKAEAVFVGGGNTFRLLKSLYDNKLLAPLRQQMEAGVPYVGWSAGANIAAPTIRTTNDMPIVEVPSLAALGLISFQINPHYLDKDPSSTHMGETREERLRQYLEENEMPVIGLREGAWLRVENGACCLGGSAGGRWFARGEEPREVEPGALLPL